MRHNTWTPRRQRSFDMMQDAIIGGVTNLIDDSYIVPNTQPNTIRRPMQLVATAANGSRLVR